MNFAPAGPFSGPLGQILRESVRSRRSSDLNFSKLGVTLIIWMQRCQNSLPMSLDGQMDLIAIRGTGRHPHP